MLHDVICQTRIALFVCPVKMHDNKAQASAANCRLEACANSPRGGSNLAKGLRKHAPFSDALRAVPKQDTMAVLHLLKQHLFDKHELGVSPPLQMYSIT